MRAYNIVNGIFMDTLNIKMRTYNRVNGIFMNTLLYRVMEW